MYKDTDREIAIQETIMSAHGVDRVQKFAFELAKQRKKKKINECNKIKWNFNYECHFGMNDLMK
jgi:tartrate dehydrogenase/decarboxylase/D-malate dehydrogenase